MMKGLLALRFSPGGWAGWALALAILVVWVIVVRLLWATALRLFPELLMIESKLLRRRAYFKAIGNYQTAILTGLFAILGLLAWMLFRDHVLPLLGASGVVRNLAEAAPLSLYLLLIFAVPPLLSRRAVRDKLREQLLHPDGAQG